MKNKKPRTITQKEANDNLGISRLSAIIYELKHAGWNIISYPIQVENRYGETTYPSEYLLKRPYRIGEKK